MHHDDHNAHVAGFRYSNETRASARRTFNALRYIKAAAIVAAVLIVARCAFGV